MITTSPKPDIRDRNDIAVVLQRFYSSAFDDAIIGFLFTDIAKVNLAEHVELITDFWASILFKEGSYTRNAMQKHVDLNNKVPLKPGHFTRWLYLFEAAVDQCYQGEMAELMKKRAHLIGNSISDAMSRKRGDKPQGVDTLSRLLQSE